MGLGRWRRKWPRGVVFWSSKSRRYSIIFSLLFVFVVVIYTFKVFGKMDKRRAKNKVVGY
jgi:hypothetical protein